MPDGPSGDLSDDRNRNIVTAADTRPAPYWWSADKLPAQVANEAKQRRIATEKAHYERGFPVAGHDRDR